MTTTIQRAPGRTTTRALALTLSLVVAGAATIAAPRAALADGASPAAATPLQREQAQERFLRAKDLFDHQAYDKALDEFRASLAIVNSPNARLYVGRCLRARGTLVDAYVELGRASVEAREAIPTDGRYELTAKEATTERDEVAATLGFVTLDVHGADASTEIAVQGRSVPASARGEAVPVEPGRVEVVATTPGRRSASRAIDVAAGAHATVSLDVPPAPPAPPSAPRAALAESASSPSTAGAAPFVPLAWGSAAVAVVGLGVFTVAGLRAHALYSDLQSACGSGPCAQDRSSDVESGTHAQTIANVGLVVGVVGAVAAVTFFVLSLSHDHARHAPSPTAWRSR